MLNITNLKKKQEVQKDYWKLRDFILLHLLHHIRLSSFWNVLLFYFLICRDIKRAKEQVTMVNVPKASILIGRHLSLLLSPVLGMF